MNLEISPSSAPKKTRAPPTPPAIIPTISRTIPHVRLEIHFALAIAIKPSINVTTPLKNALRPPKIEAVKIPTKGLLNIAITPKITSSTPPINARMEPAYDKEFKEYAPLQRNSLSLVYEMF